MKHSIVRSAVLWLSAAVLLSINLSLFAADDAPAATGAKPPAKVKDAGKDVKAKNAKATAKVKLVDINSAGKAELKTLPGISDAEADKIIAGRPYLSKANLLTHNIVSKEAYATIKARVVAKQNKATAAKLSEMEKKR